MKQHDNGTQKILGIKTLYNVEIEIDDSFCLCRGEFINENAKVFIQIEGNVDDEDNSMLLNALYIHYAPLIGYSPQNKPRYKNYKNIVRITPDSPQYSHISEAFVHFLDIYDYYLVRLATLVYKYNGNISVSDIEDVFQYKG